MCFLVIVVGDDWHNRTIEHLINSSHASMWFNDLIMRLLKWPLPIGMSNKEENHILVLFHFNVLIWMFCLCASDTTMTFQQTATHTEKHNICIHYEQLSKKKENRTDHLESLNSQLIYHNKVKMCWRVVETRKSRAKTKTPI